LTDTFAPAAPKGLQAVANQGSISLIWDPNPEKDLGGYLVFRGTQGGAPAQITPSPVEQAMLNDAVPPGVQYTYLVKAVDRAGNASAPSSEVQGMAR
jgi:fibronectin type 3 domain-containing protein